MKKKIILFVSLLIQIMSCNSKNSFGYSENKIEYQGAVNCIRGNYSLIFPASNGEQSKSLYRLDFQRSRFCSEILNLFNKYSIEFVSIDRDSTVAFYTSSKDLVKSKQHILMFIVGKKRLNEKIPSDIKIVNINDDSCYELERIISVAN